MRVKEAKDLVAHKDYEDAVRQYIEQERAARDLRIQLRDTLAELERQRETSRQANDKSREAAERLEKVEAERDDALGTARNHQEDASRYQEALKKAVTDVAHFTSKSTSSEKPEIPPG